MESFQFQSGTACNKELPAKFVKQNEIDLKTRLVHKILDGNLIKQVALKVTHPIN
jgi:hypothetical protein